MFSLQIDYSLFHWINQLGAHYTAWNPIMRFLASDAEYLFYLGIIIYWFTRIAQNRRMVAEALLAACIGLGISGSLGHFLYRDRPFVTHTVILLIKHPANASFPSDHATAAFVIAAAIWQYRRKEGIIWLALAALIAFSRIWVGVHYPLDVFAGACLGMICAAGVHPLKEKWTWLERCLNTAIGFYESIEHKLWAKKENHYGEADSKHRESKEITS